MSKNSLLFSVIIPTKNRHDQLLETILAHSFWPEHLRDKFELVIADNSHVALPEKSLDEVKNIFPNTIYNNIPSYLTISENFSSALKMSSGEWVVFIGDDDFFMPSIIEVLDNYNDKNVDCLIYNPNKYYWKNCVFKNKNVDGAPGALLYSLPWPEGPIIAKEELTRSLRNGGLTIERMPRIYHGLVRKSIVDKLCLHESGEMVLGSPDISLATILSCSDINVYSIPKSLTVYGASDGSGGGMTTSKSHVLTIDKATHLSADFRNEWEESIPKYWSEYTVFPASMFFIAQQYGVKLPVKLNYAATYIACFLNEYPYRKFVYSALRNLKKDDLVSLVFNTPYALIRKLFGKLSRYIKSQMRKQKNYLIEPSELYKFNVKDAS